MDEMVDYLKDTLPDNEIFVEGNTLFYVEFGGGFRVYDKLFIPEDDNHVIDTGIRVGVHYFQELVEVFQCERSSQKLELTLVGPQNFLQNTCQCSINNIVYNDYLEWGSFVNSPYFSEVENLTLTGEGFIGGFISLSYFQGGIIGGPKMVTKC